ncbi:hypothetical protein N9M41_08355, partial [Rhodopirellula sp.]|nr:hypothetical protein [Rhodopirellula sp.]
MNPKSTACFASSQSMTFETSVGTFTFFLIAVLFASASHAQESHWSQWRGSNGTGKTSSNASVTQWDANTNLKWRSALPEAGNSTPV